LLGAGPQTHRHIHYLSSIFPGSLGWILTSLEGDSLARIIQRLFPLRLAEHHKSMDHHDLCRWSLAGQRKQTAPRRTCWRRYRHGLLPLAGSMPERSRLTRRAELLGRLAVDRLRRLEGADDLPVTLGLEVAVDLCQQQIRERSVTSDDDL